MELKNFVFVFIELMVVINSSYAYEYFLPHQTYNRNRVRLSPSIQRQCETPILKNGSVRLRQRGKLIRYNCLQSFTLIGDRYSACNQGQWENPVPMCIKNGCSPVAPPRNGFTLVDKNGAVTLLFCIPGFSIAGSHETFCNGTAWDRSLGSCRETQASPAMYCDFEVNNICDWEADPTSDFEWARKNGYTSVKQLQTGPSHDNTIGVPLEGHYMLATFASQSPGAVARLISPLYPAEASKDACFRFYYHMYGALTGVLRIYMKPKSITLTELLETTKYLFVEKIGSHENAWLESFFEIDEYMEDFQIVVEATAARSTRSNIAIDDVALMSGADCINEELKSTTVDVEEGGIFDAQSCVNRCMETAPYSRYVTESIVNENKTVNVLQCDCYVGCEDQKSCCLDYRTVCVFDVSTAESTDSEPVTEIISSTTSTVSTTTSKSSSISSTISPSTSTTTPIPTTTVTSTTKTISTTKTVNPKPMSTIKATSIAPPITVPKTIKVTSTTSTTPKPTTPKPTTPKPTTPKPTTPKPTTPKPTTPKPTTPKPTTPKLTTNFVTLKFIKGTTPIVPTSTEKSTKYFTTSTAIQVTTCNQNQKCGKDDDDWNATDIASDADPVLHNLLIFFGIVLLLATIVTTGKLYHKYQNRFNYKSKTKRYSEDASDEVRFLTADEQLDFTMQTEDDCRH